AAATWQAYGETLEKLGQQDLARKAFERALARKKGPVPGRPEPKNANKYNLGSLKNAAAQDAYRRGAAYLEDHFLLYAIQEFEKALTDEPDNPELIDIAARSMVDYGEEYFSPALDLLKKYRKIKGDAEMGHDRWVALGRAATQAKKYDFALAEEALNSALKLNAKSLPAQLAMGELKLMRGEYAPAIEWFTKAAEQNKTELRVLWGLGDAHAGLKEHAKALEFYNDAYSQYPQNAEAAYKYAVGLKHLNLLDDSIHFHEVAIGLDPTKARYHLGLVAIYLPRIMDFSAKKHLDAALALEPENPWCYFYYGLYLEMRRRIDEAIEKYEFAKHFGPQMLDVRYQLANIYMGIGNSFPGNNFSGDKPADLVEYMPYKDLKRAYQLYKEIVTINPKYEHAAKIQTQLATVEELYEIQQKLNEEDKRPQR
ncbi:MAG TPA: tetratricopeptide repeat protein, partial [Candidatus Ozemobacteraceae bacterium]|nr:tetratricopeptide repeat protein [Candidatus Ozemobacteraceae bacterium]